MQHLIINVILSHLQANTTSNLFRKNTSLFQNVVFSHTLKQLSLVIKVSKLVIYMLKVENISFWNGAITCLNSKLFLYELKVSPLLYRAEHSCIIDRSNIHLFYQTREG